MTFVNRLKGARSEPASSPLRDDSVRVVQRDALNDLLERLPKREAQVIALAYFGELTHVEIAEQLGLSEEWVKGRMRFGISELDRAEKDRDRTA